MYLKSTLWNLSFEFIPPKQSGIQTGLRWRHLAQFHTRSCARCLTLFFLMLQMPIALAEAANSHFNQDTLTPLEAQGRELYLEGKGSNGQVLTAIGADNTKLSGIQASCVSCHRRSGLGGVEGNEVILPITGHALFGGGKPVNVQIDKQYNKSLSSQSKFYDDSTFAKALRLGQHISGRNLSPLMPRYTISTDQLKALAAYLRTLSTAWSPGVNDQEIHLATIITPNVSPQLRQSFLNTLNALIDQHNVNVVAGLRQRIPPIERKMHNRRYWKVDVWDLKGPSTSWAEQLKTWQQQSPVFAILSGLSKDEWQPVQQFCEVNQIPCWFPSIDIVPNDANKETYSLYFSEGVKLEAKVIANQILQATPQPKKIIQLIGENASAQSAAEALRQALSNQGIEILSVEWDQQGILSTTDRLKTLLAEDVLVCWLNTNELNALTDSTPAPLTRIYLSSTLTGENIPHWTKDWAQQAWLIQRTELPKMRAANLSRFSDWLSHWRLPLIDEKMQSEVYFSVNSFSWIVSSMLNNFYTDYLIDQAEATLSMRETMQVQEEVQSMMMGGGGRRPQAIKINSETLSTQVDTHRLVDISLLSKRESITAYPRISFGIGQRFGSKGAYVRKFIPDQNNFDETNAQWIVP